MNCLMCKEKSCKSRGADCAGDRDETVALYSTGKNRSTYVHADALVSQGRAGTLSRLDEITEFCRSEGFTKVGIAYCYGIEDLARDVMKTLKAQGLKVTSYRCTLGGIEEPMIDEALKGGVNCNPIGQARAIEADGADFVIEMGLCLGHDVLFHKHLTVPFTVFTVKDRVYNHNPAVDLPSYRDKTDEFLENLDESFQMRNAQWLAEMIESRTPVVILDVRSPEGFNSGRVSNSINIPLIELPRRYHAELDSYKDAEIICLCNGSVQSAYAVSYLYSKGFKKVYNLSGGYSRLRDEYPEHITTGKIHTEGEAFPQRKEV